MLESCRQGLELAGPIEPCAGLACQPSDFCNRWISGLLGRGQKGAPSPWTHGKQELVVLASGKGERQGV